MAARRVWFGPDALRPTLKPLGSLRPHERNPRKGDVDEIRRSLVRFGQQRPVLVDASGAIVAGNHTYLAATAEGWTHVAAVETDLTEPAEIERYLVADNRTSDLGTYDHVQLHALLSDVTDYAGTGYDADEIATIAALARPQTPAGGDLMLRMILRYDRGTYDRIIERLTGLMDEWNLDSFSAVVERAVTDAAP